MSTKFNSDIGVSQGAVLRSLLFSVVRNLLSEQRVGGYFNPRVIYHSTDWLVKY